MILFIAGERLNAEAARRIVDRPDGCEEIESYEVVDFVNTHRTFAVALRIGLSLVAVIATIASIAL